jgi:putative transposase
MPSKKRSPSPASKPVAGKERKSRSRSSSATSSTVQHRRIEPGCTYLITKKTNDDLFWLAPSPLVNAILLFLLILKATKHGMLIHGFVFLSTHFHLLVTDVGVANDKGILEGRLPAFMCEFLTESGKALKVGRKTTRRVWSGRRYSATHLLDLDAAERKLAYALLNPLEAALTLPEKWPGLTSVSFRFGDTISATRPGIYFSKKRPGLVSLILAPLVCAFPAGPESEATLAPAAPAPVQDSARDPAAEDASATRIRELVEIGRTTIHRRLEQEGRKLAGVERVLRTPWTRRSTHPIGDLNPRFATRDAKRLEDAIEEMWRFERDHDAAKERYTAGHHRTLFPSGTYGYRVVLGVRVAKRRRPAA